MNKFLIGSMILFNSVAFGMDIDPDLSYLPTYQDQNTTYLRVQKLLDTLLIDGENEHFRRFLLISLQALKKNTNKKKIKKI